MKKILHRSRTVAGKIRRSKYSRRIMRANEMLLIFILFVALFSYLTNPFTKFNVVKEPFKINYLPNGQLSITPVLKIYLVDNPILSKLGDLKSAWHILSNRFTGGRGSKSDTLEGIIDDIHALRFNPKQPYIISGDHFTVLYPRSLGIFYNTMLDPRTARSEQDWKNRQEMYLQTTLYVLSAYQRAKRLSTTITPTGPESVTLNNYFDPPSDTMYSILYALRSLETADDIFSYYPFAVDYQIPVIQTSEASKQTVGEYKQILQRHFDQYVSDVVDPQTGLVRTDKSFSGTKDSVVRFSSFYDNVIFWKTVDLAGKLGITPVDQEKLNSLKEKILSTFWLPEEGYFLEDLSENGKQKKFYSSDWLIALMTGFISPFDTNESEYFIRSVEYIRREKLNEPFGLKYQSVSQKSTLHLPLRIFAPMYGTQAIWSHWGMEYVKLLNLLYQKTCDETYLNEAQKQLAVYEQNILSTKGYPELYDPQGQIFNNLFYKSVNQTGWVVNFEQANIMTKNTSVYKDNYCSDLTGNQEENLHVML